MSSFKKTRGRFYSILRKDSLKLEDSVLAQLIARWRLTNGDRWWLRHQRDLGRRGSGRPAGI